MTTIRFSFAWQPVDGAERYDIFRYNLASALASLVGSAASSVTSTGIGVTEGENVVYQVRGVYDDGSYSIPQTFYRGRPNILAVFRQEIRRKLKDIDPENYKWSDEELNQYIRDAFLDWSRHFPVASETTISTTSGAIAYVLVDAVAITDVVYVRDGTRYHLKPKGWKGGEVERTTTAGIAKLGIFRAGSRAYAGHFDYRENEIVLDFDPEAGNSLEVHYGANHTIPIADTDELAVLVIDQEILSLYVQANAWARVGGQDASLSRWDEQGKRDDSPIIPRETRLFNAYYRKVEDRKEQPRSLRRVRI